MMLPLSNTEICKKNLKFLNRSKGDMVRLFWLSDAQKSLSFVCASYFDRFSDLY